MIAAVSSLVIAFAAGAVATMASGQKRMLFRSVGESMLVGIAICAASLFALAVARIAWSLAAAMVVVAVVAIAIAIAGRRRRNRTDTRATVTAALPRLAFVSHLLDVLTLATIAGYALLSTAGPIAEIDFVAAWGLKARAFWIARGFDWAFLENPWYRWIHADYPPLLPLAFDWMTLFSGHWDDRWLALLNPYFALALLLIVRSLLEEELGSRIQAALITFALAPLAASPWIGIAEGPLVAYGTAGVLLMRRAISRHSGFEYAAIFLGLAAATKNEGLALLIAAVMAMLSTRERRSVWRLWPAAAIALPWLLIRAVHNLSTDLARGEPLRRIAEHSQHPLALLRTLASQTTGYGLFWFGVIVALLLGARRVAREERFAVISIVLLLIFDLVAYQATSQDVAWLVRWSWERLLAQAAVIAAFVATVVACETARKLAVSP